MQHLSAPELIGGGKPAALDEVLEPAGIDADGGVSNKGRSTREGDAAYAGLPDPVTLTDPIAVGRRVFVWGRRPSDEQLAMGGEPSSAGRGVALRLPGG
jgi:hypothetical protein